MPLALKGRRLEDANAKRGQMPRKSVLQGAGSLLTLRLFPMLSSAFSQKAKPGRDTPSAWGEERSFVSGAWHEFSKDSITRSSKCLNQQNEFRTNLALTVIGCRFASLRCLPAFPYNKSGLSGS